MMNLSGEYKATVVDNNDSKNLNRVKVRVKGLMDGIPEDNLPWAKCKSLTPSVKGGSDFKPEKDSKVWVSFAEGDINDAYWRGGVIEEKDDLPKNHKDGRFIIYESAKSGICITVNEDLGDIEIKTKTYNTTLGTIVELFLGHAHQTSLGPTALPITLEDLMPIILANFTKGTLK